MTVQTKIEARDLSVKSTVVSARLRYMSSMTRSAIVASATKSSLAAGRGQSPCPMKCNP